MSNYQFRKSNNSSLCISGFTVLKVFAIIIIVFGLGFGVYYGSEFVSNKFRDIKRNFDITGLQKALELYSDNYGGYPKSSPICLDGSDSVSSELKEKKLLLRSVSDPRFPDLNPKKWSPADNKSCYYYESDGSIYFIGYCTEGMFGDSECKYVRKK